MNAPAVRRRPDASILAAPLLWLCLLAPGCGGGGPSWTQWGGPAQDFRAASEGLAATWPEEGPPVLWRRALGDGYSGIVVEDGRLYTMYRDGSEESVVCLDAGTGETLWEQRYQASPGDGHDHQKGDGPRATPLIAGDRIYTIGVSGKLHCLRKRDGEPVWSRDLWGEFRGNFLMHGYASSPVAYGTTVITLVGGPGAAIVAFDQRDGSVVWSRHEFQNSYSSPKIVRVEGQDLLLAFMASELVGVDPADGELHWVYRHENEWGQNIGMPILSADGKMLFISSPRAGARGLALEHKGREFDVREVWETRKIQFFHVTAVRDGNHVYGSTGILTPTLMAGFDMTTGEIAWRRRDLAKANCLWADGRLIILDEDGVLYLATATPEGLTVHSSVELLDGVAWTVPTLVGQTLFLRDRNQVMALDLGETGRSS